MDDPPVRRLRVGRGDERALPLPPRPGADGTVGRLRPADAARLRLGPPALRRRGRPVGRGDRLAGRHGARLRRDPPRPGVDLDDDQRPGGSTAPPVRADGRAPGCPGSRAARNRSERRPQGVRRARELHLPAPPVDANHHRSLRVLPRATPALEHDLDLRLPHPRGGLDGRAGARVHTRERDRLLRGGGRRRTLSGRVRRAVLVLLQRAQRLLPGGREVPCRKNALGAHHARALRRGEPEGAGPSLPRADRRLDADRPAAGEQHRPGRDPGSLGGLRRRAVAAHERLRRGSGTADRALSADRAANPADHPARGRHDRHGRPARRLLLPRVADEASSKSAPGS